MHPISTLYAHIGNYHMLCGRPVSAVVAHTVGAYWRVWGL
jgi:hypothetical protein